MLLNRVFDLIHKKISYFFIDRIESILKFYEMIEILIKTSSKNKVYNRFTTEVTYSEYTIEFRDFISELL